MVAGTGSTIPRFSVNWGWIRRISSRAVNPGHSYIKSNTVLAFGGAVQMPGTGVKCDLDMVDLKCPGRRRLRLDFETDLGPETGSAALGWKLNPVDLRDVRSDLAQFGAGERTVDVLPLFGEDANFEQEEVPFAPAGLAAGSLKSFVPGGRDASTRVRLSTSGDVLVFAFLDHSLNAQVTADENGFEIRCRQRSVRVRRESNWRGYTHHACRRDNVTGIVKLPALFVRRTGLPPVEQTGSLRRPCPRTRRGVPCGPACSAGHCAQAGARDSILLDTLRQAQGTCSGSGSALCQWKNLGVLRAR